MDEAKKSEIKKETDIRGEGRYKKGTEGGQATTTCKGKNKKKRIDHKALEEHTDMKVEGGMEGICSKKEGPNSVQVTISGLRTISGRKFSKGKQAAMKNLGGRAEQSNT